MQFPKPLIEGRPIRRYKRFLADVELADGSMVTAHTPNTGSMMGCAEPGLRVWLSVSDNPKRKYPLSWELVESSSGALVGINTGLPTRLVTEGIDRGVITELQGYTDLRPEVRYGEESSCIDLLLEEGDRRRYVEIKNVTLANGEGVAQFPDAVTSRGTRHLRELMRVVAKEGARGVMVYCVQRSDVRAFSPPIPSILSMVRRYGRRSIKVWRRWLIVPMFHLRPFN